MQKQYRLQKNKLGFFEVEPKPTLKELEEHYSKKYFQQGHGSYSSGYNQEELDYFNNQAELCKATLTRYFNCKNSLLDVGCGEGFFSSYFYRNGWDVTCIDFSAAGITQHNPHLSKFFKKGDVFSTLDEYQQLGLEFGLLNLDNVLEHVLDPLKLLLSMKTLMTKTSVARIEVPNDFSAFQALLIERECTSETWVNPPEHLSYFNKNGLVNILESAGLAVVSLQADFPIEQFLLNDNSNYWKKRELGKAAHQTRVTCTNYLMKKSIDRFLDYSEAAADLEFGRLLTAYVKLADA